MAYVAGALSAVKLGSNYAQLLSGPATGGTGPYTYQWYKSFTTGFTPGSAYLIPGATALAFTDTQLLPATHYFYRVVATDLGAGSATVNSAELDALTVAGSPVEMNQLVQTPVIGMTDQPQNPNTKSVVMDSSYGGAAVPGTAVKQIAPTGVTTGSKLNTLPHVIPVTANSDAVLGFIQFNPKDTTYVAGAPMELSESGNVSWQMATANGVAGDPMQLDVTVPGGLQTVVGASGATICGRAMDTPVVGMPFRLEITASVPKASA